MEVQLQMFFSDPSLDLFLGLLYLQIKPLKIVVSGNIYFINLMLLFKFCYRFYEEA